MLGDVDGRAAIFAAERDALEDPQHDEQGRGERAGLRIGRQESDQEGRSAHQANGGEECALAADAVADDSEDERTERAEGESGGEQAERGDQRGRRVERREEGVTDDRRERAEDEEVVPLERGPGGRGDDHPAHRPRPLAVWLSCARHQTPPPSSEG